MKKNLSKVLNTFENIMENGAFAPGANAPFSILIFHSNMLYLKGVKRRYYGVKGYKRFCEYVISTKISCAEPYHLILK